VVTQHSFHKCAARTAQSPPYDPTLIVGFGVLGRGQLQFRDVLERIGIRLAVVTGNPECSSDVVVTNELLECREHLL
jgi:hypothetical protein